MKTTTWKNFLKRAFITSLPLVFFMNCHTTQTEEPVEPRKEQIGDAPAFPEKAVRDTAKTLRPVKFGKPTKIRTGSSQVAAPGVNNQLVADAKHTAHDGTYAQNNSDAGSSDLRKYGIPALAMLSVAGVALIVRKRARQ